LNTQLDPNTQDNPAVNDDALPPEHQHIIDLVEDGAQVLDLGCGYGNLLKALQADRHVRAQGIDLSDEAIQVCVSKGLFVFHGDLDEGLADFNDQSVDYVISVNTLQVLHHPEVLLREMARVGKKIIVGIPNFGHWSVRAQLFFLGRMPKSARIPYEWYNSPNIHHTTINDFRDLCRQLGLEVIQETALRTRKDGSVSRVSVLPNLLGDYAIFLMQRAS
jgi:methionine biosynthesis protein MetW